MHNEAGLAALQTGNIDRAKTHLEAGIRAAKTIGDSHLVMLVSLSYVKRAEQDYDGARSTLQEVIRTGRRMGSKTATAYALLALACLSTDR